MLTNVCQYGVQLDLEPTTPPKVSWAYLSETPRVIYYPHYAYTGDRTHVSQAFIKSSDARVNVGLS